AGPTGLATALMLARQGWRTTVFERFEAAQPVGAGFMLQPTGLGVLDRLGLTEKIEALGQTIDHIFGQAAPTGRIVLDVRYSDLKRPRRAIGVHRAAIFHVLREACLEAGVAFEFGKDVVGASSGRLTFVSGQSSSAFDLVVDASGARSNIARAHGAAPRALSFGALWTTTPWPSDPRFDRNALQQVYKGAAKMIGVLPVGVRPGSRAPLATFFWSLKTRDYPAIDHPDALSLARYGHHTLARPYGDRLAVVGDAAHSTSPQLGQGVNMGLLDADALARALEGASDLNEALAAYAKERRWHLRLYQALSLGFTPFYQSDGGALPWIRDHVLGRLARLPTAPHLLACTVSGFLLDPRR
ncbi:hypothetical protein LTR94_024743, partial [Friedmanniomyces endolithicus]